MDLSHLPLQHNKLFKIDTTPQQDEHEDDDNNHGDDDDNTDADCGREM